QRMGTAADPAAMPGPRPVDGAVSLPGDATGVGPWHRGIEDAATRAGVPAQPRHARRVRHRVVPGRAGRGYGAAAIAPRRRTAASITYRSDDAAAGLTQPEAAPVPGRFALPKKVHMLIYSGAHP